MIVASAEEICRLEVVVKCKPKGEEGKEENGPETVGDEEETFRRRELQLDNTDDILNTLLNDLYIVKNTTVGIVDDVYTVGVELQTIIVNKTETLYDHVTDEIATLRSDAYGIVNTLVIVLLAVFAAILVGLILFLLIFCQVNRCMANNRKKNKNKEDKE